MAELLPQGLRLPLAVGLIRSDDTVYGRVEYGQGTSRRRRVRSRARQTATVQWRIPLCQLGTFTEWYEGTLQAGALEFALPVQDRTQLPDVDTVLATFAEPPRISIVSAWASISAEVVVRRPELAVTSRPYPVEAIESMTCGLTVLAVEEPGFAYPPEGVDVGLSVAGGQLAALLQSVDTWPAESLDAAMTVSGGELAALLQAIDTWPAESLDAAIVPTGGDLQTILITYANWPTEAMNAAMTVTAAEIVT